jgi:predicted naringenin-chalcone synthase
MEEVLIEDYNKNNPDKFNVYISQLMNALELQKQEDEKSVVFESRLFGDINKILGLELK